MKAILVPTMVLAILLGISSSASAQPARGAVYVASQGLCYATFVAAESLPPQGPFQLITPSTICGPGSSMTQFGPGDPGYVGGRWVTPEGDRFLCPLVGPAMPRRSRSASWGAWERRPPPASKRPPSTGL
jgi:hypothetical protein